MICEMVIQVPQGRYQHKEGSVLAFICPKCSLTHLALYMNSYVYSTVALTEDQAILLSQQLINPPTSKGIGLEVAG